MKVINESSLSRLQRYLEKYDVGFITAYKNNSWIRDKYQKAVTTQLNQSGEIETISITGKEDSHEQ